MQLSSVMLTLRSQDPGTETEEGRNTK